MKCQAIFSLKKIPKTKSSAAVVISTLRLLTIVIKKKIYKNILSRAMQWHSFNNQPHKQRTNATEELSGNGRGGCGGGEESCLIFVKNTVN